MSEKLQATGLILQPPPKRARLMTSGTVTRFSRAWWADAVRNQGQRPWCVAFAFEKLLRGEPNPMGRHMTIEELGKLYRRAQQVDGIPGTNYDGTTLEGGFKAFKEAGYLRGNMVVGNTIEQVALWLRDRGPVVVGTDWTFNMAVPRSGGRVRPTGSSQGGHAWIINGADFLNASSGEFYGVNSHGTHYGNKGHLTITARDLATLFGRGGYALSALQNT